MTASSSASLRISWNLAEEETGEAGQTLSQAFTSEGVIPRIFFLVKDSYATSAGQNVELACLVMGRAGLPGPDWLGRVYFSKAPTI